VPYHILHSLGGGILFQLRLYLRNTFHRAMGKSTPI
jgi:hypothetical protein